MRMRTVVSSLLATGLVFAIVVATAPAAFADHGGKAMRKGRFVWHAPTAKAEQATPQAPSPREVRGVTYDKGDRGVYVRHGRTVTKVYKASGRASASKTDYDATRRRVVDHVKHKHYLP